MTMGEKSFDFKWSETKSELFDYGSVVLRQGIAIRIFYSNPK